MSNSDQIRIGYVVKRYPRFSETFIVNEILAHEAAGGDVEIFSLRPPVDTHFQNSISRVKAPVTYLTIPSMKAAGLWESIQEGAGEFPDFWNSLEAFRDEDIADVLMGMQLARIIRRRGIDHLHAHFATSATTVARIAARLADIDYTFTAHAKDIYHESVCPRDLERKLRDAYAAVTVSDFNVFHLRETYPSLSRNVHGVYNGMPLDELCYSPPTQRPRQIVAVGRLVAKKGFEVLLDACARLQEREVDFRCAIIGTGELEASLRAQVKHLGLEGIVELQGARPQNDVMRVVRESAVLAAPCVIGDDGNRDGLPTVLLEAMALGTPCVATDVTGIPEVVQHEQTGLLVPQNDPIALANALQQILDDEHLSQRLAENARRLLEERFDVQRNARQLRQLFEHAVSSRQSASIEFDPAVVSATKPDLQEVL